MKAGDQLRETPAFMRIGIWKHILVGNEDISILQSLPEPRRGLR